MPYMTLKGVPPYDGRYELRLEGDLFTIFEWGWIKRFAGYLPATVWEGFDGGDAELIATFAVIALYRAGRVTEREARDVFEQLGRGQLASTVQIEPDEDDVEDDASPPPVSSNANGSTSGHGSPASSVSQAVTPPATGTPASATSGLASTMSAT